MTDLFDGPVGRAKGGRIIALADTKKEAAEAAMRETQRVAIFSSFDIPYDCRVFPKGQDREAFIADVKKWADEA